MKTNIFVNKDNVITGWICEPLNASLPIYDIEEPKSIRVGYDKFIEGKVVKDDEAYNKVVEAAEELNKTLTK